MGTQTGLGRNLIRRASRREHGGMGCESFKGKCTGGCVGHLHCQRHGQAARHWQDKSCKALARQRTLEGGGMSSGSGDPLAFRKHWQRKRHHHGSSSPDSDPAEGAKTLNIASSRPSCGSGAHGSTTLENSGSPLLTPSSSSSSSLGIQLPTPCHCEHA
jgi:hypothetical protein